MFATASHIDGRKREKLGVLFCHAFGEERQKIYRSTFHFANTLADHGIPSMRFDYIGTGDSDGDLPDVSLDSMLSNTLCSAGQARDILNVENLLLLGIRLGAVVAARATSKLDWLDTCIMWNPIIDGAEYLQELKRTEKIIKLTGKPSNGRPLILPDNDDCIVIEADLMTSRMVGQLQAVDLTTEPLSVSHLFVAGRKDDKKEKSNISKFADSRKESIEHVDCWLKQPREYWSTRSMYDAYFPTPTFDATLQWIDYLTKTA